MEALTAADQLAELAAPAEPVELDHLDAAGLLGAAASGSTRARRSAEVTDLLVLAQWAAVHGTDPPGAGRCACAGGAQHPGRCRR